MDDRERGRLDQVDRMILHRQGGAGRPALPRDQTLAAGPLNE